MIELLQTEFSEARKNLALEEAILDDFLKEERTPLIRLWANEERSAVLGRGEKADQQLNLDACLEHELPVLRRVSGGGTVLHGPGNLNLSFFLPWSFHSDLKNLSASYSLILGWVQEAIAQVTGVKPTKKGSCDLCLGDKKISGTAQARKRHGLLHHLTLLVDFDLNQIPLFLKEPEKRPDYRTNRQHLDFVTTFRSEGLDLPKESLIEALQASIGAMTPLASPNDKNLTKCLNLAENKYKSERWNLEGRTPIS